MSAVSRRARLGLTPPPRRQPEAVRAVSPNEERDDPPDPRERHQQNRQQRKPDRERDALPEQRRSERRTPITPGALRHGLDDPTEGVADVRQQSVHRYGPPIEWHIHERRDPRDEPEHHERQQPRGADDEVVRAAPRFPPREERQGGPPVVGGRKQDFAEHHDAALPVRVSRTGYARSRATSSTLPCRVLIEIDATRPTGSAAQTGAGRHSRFSARGPLGPVRAPRADSSRRTAQSI